MHFLQTMFLLDVSYSLWNQNIKAADYDKQFQVKVIHHNYVQWNSIYLVILIVAESINK